MEDDEKNCDRLKQTKEVKLKSFSIDSLLSNNNDVKKIDSCNSSIIYSSSTSSSSAVNASTFHLDSDNRLVRFRTNNYDNNNGIGVGDGDCDDIIDDDMDSVNDDGRCLRNLPRNSYDSDKSKFDTTNFHFHDNYQRVNDDITQRDNCNKEQHDDVVSTSEEMCERSNEG